MNSISFQRKEWMAPARRVVVVMTISDDPAIPLIELSPDKGDAMAKGDSVGIARKNLRFSKLQALQK
jgi:hypothetical protein